MKYKDMSNTQKLIDEIIKKFELEDEPYNRSNIRKKLSVICKRIPAVKNGLNTNLWDKTRIKFDGRKKAEHFFSEAEKNVVLNHPDLKAYILKNLSVKSNELEQRLAKEVKEEKELKKEADKLNKKNAELDELPETDIVDSDDFDEDLTASYFYSREEAHQEKLFMMVEALFLKHFTPIDEELLWKDMNKMPLLASTNTDFTPEIMKAIKRFENKDYYKPLDKSIK